jgi:succinate dehydrogenase/fumarate reductase flavoprotein subunit
MTNFQSHRDLGDRQILETAAGGEGPAVFDVVVVGSGAAAHSAAVMAGRGGSKVVMLEVADRIGGTSWRSSGGYWIPNNPPQRERGVKMEREATLKHMASLSYPDRFDPAAERLGLGRREYDLLATFFDEAPRIIDEYEEEGILSSVQMDYPGRDDGMPPYWETAYDRTSGTVLGPRAMTSRERQPATNLGAEAMQRLTGGEQGDGADLIAQLAETIRELGAEVRLEHRATAVVQDGDGAVIGVVCDTPEGEVTIYGRQGVVFATGGFSHAPELAARYLRGPIVGSCSVGTARGDFVGIALEAGAELGNMSQGWWTELPVELVKTMPEAPELMAWIPGASSVVVNAHGERVVNEKLQYNERGKVHFVQDEDGGWPNRLLFLVYDDAVARDDGGWPGRWPVPPPGETGEHVIEGATLAELGQNIAARLAGLADQVGGFRLEDDFVDGLTRTIERFGRFAEAGVDEDFGRGSTDSDRGYSEPPRPGLPNGTMAPFETDGPFYAMILGAATLDTKGGPKIDVSGRVLGAGGTPIPGLYGAGNCIASPAGEAYWGGGGTLGPALVFGYIAGRSVALEPRRQVDALGATAPGGRGVLP